MELGGLTEWDAGRMAQIILSGVGRTPGDFRDDSAYSELIRLLNGFNPAVFISWK